jgi:hypothetical protein
MVLSSLPRRSEAVKEVTLSGGVNIWFG